MWRHKTDRRLIAAGLFILAMVIGFNAWLDLQPKPVRNHQASIAGYVLVTRAEEVDIVKKDPDVSAIFWAGDIAGDPAAMTLSPLPPVVLTQQAYMPLFTLTEVPKALSPVFALIEKAIDPWIGRSGLVNEIYIDYRAQTPDLDALASFVNGIRGHFERQYWVVAGIKRTSAAFPQETKTKLGNMLKGVEYFVYNLDDVTAGNEPLASTISRIDSEGIPFMIRTAKKHDYETLQRELADGKQYFGGFIIEAPAFTPQEKSK